MLGVNFEKGDLNLTAAQIRAAKTNLPATAIHSFELGNEVCDGGGPR